MSNLLFGRRRREQPFNKALQVHRQHEIHSHKLFVALDQNEEFDKTIQFHAIRNIHDLFNKQHRVRIVQKHFAGIHQTQKQNFFFIEFRQFREQQRNEIKRRLHNFRQLSARQKQQQIPLHRQIHEDPRSEHRKRIRGAIGVERHQRQSFALQN